MVGLIFIPCSHATDGTALKPGVQFDSTLKENVGLTVKAHLDFCRKNSHMNAKDIKPLFVAEAVPMTMFVTTLDNKNAMPVANDYLPRKKSGEDTFQLFEDRIKTIQGCRACLSRTPSPLHTVEWAGCKCHSFCQSCWELQVVCRQCAAAGHSSHFHAPRACNTCITRGQKCERIAVFIVTTDCEESNKQALMKFTNKLEDGSLKPELHLAVPLPDAIHLGKTWKCSWANWSLLIDGCRSTLNMFYALQNVNNQLKKLITVESVRNKDRMAVDPIIRITRQPVLDALQAVGSMVYTVIPEKLRMWDSNKPGMYPHPVAITGGELGHLLVIDFDMEKKT